MMADTNRAAAMVRGGGKKTKADTFLSIDICMEILLRLPASSVLRFRKVCKQWRNIIGEPQFMPAHYLQQQHAPAQHKTVVFFPRKFNLSTQAHDRPACAVVFDELERAPRLLWSASSPYADIDMIGTCNGLLCFCNNSKHVIGLANPASGESLAVPMPPGATYARTLIHKYDTYSFSFDPRTRQYKIIHLPVNQNWKFDEVQVYTLGDKSWREVSTPGASLCPGGNIISINGTTYWVPRRANRVMSFDLRAELLASIELPPFEASGGRRHYLTELNARLFMAIPRLVWCRFGKMAEEATIWRLEEGRELKWSHFCTVEPVRWLEQRFARPHFLHGEHLLTCPYYEAAHLHNLREDTADLFPVGRLLNFGTWTKAFLYADTFAPLSMYES